MCGIGGIVSLREGAPPGMRALERMVAAIRHRGPDASGIHRDDRAGLVHTRLAIVDLAGGAQPMSDASGTRTIVFNGEIYNHRELRAELEARGRVFRTNSDTEVLLEAWLEWGEAALEKLNGQWAFALWDARERSLVLARDRFGVRPLVYREANGVLWFASEAKAIFAADPTCPRRFDPDALLEALTFWSVLAPRTTFEGIAEVEPGHVRIWRNGNVRDRRFWDASFPRRGERPFRGNLDDAIEAVFEAMRVATERRLLHADVPVGAYLSGGIDSAFVTALAARVSPGRLATFSIRFDDAEYDESEHQRTIVERLGLAHHDILVRDTDLAAAFPDAIVHTERVVVRGGPVPLYLLSEATKKAGVSVVLTGEGADEVFAGYDLFREGRVRRFWARQPGSRVRPLLLQRLYPYLSRSPAAHPAMARAFFGIELAEASRPGFAHGPRWRNGVALARLLAPELRERAKARDPRAELLARVPEGFGAWTPLAQDQWLEIRTLLGGYLLAAQGDRVAMAHAVEGRFPFLDPNVVELAASLPDEHKLLGLREKHVLKRAAARVVPDAIVRREKRPYRAPDGGAVFRGRRQEWVEETMSERSVREAGVFDEEAVSRLVERARGEAPLTNQESMGLYAILSAQVLHDRLLRAPLERSSGEAFDVREVRR